MVEKSVSKLEGIGTVSVNLLTNSMQVDFDENMLKLGFENYIRTDSSIPESNGIGLKTCSKIMEYMGGRVIVYDDEERFVLRLYLSVEEKNDNISNT